MFNRNSIILVILSWALTACASKDYRTASRESTGIAPKPEELKEAIFQIYTARAFNWRGYFGIHPWVAWKKIDEPQYTVAQAIGWRNNRGLSQVSVELDVPDRRWFDNEPRIIFEARGEKAEKIIEHVKKLIANYPASKYRLWPGPNSNTFVDYLIRNTPELTVELPSDGIGKDYLLDSWFFAKSPTGTGIQFSLFGILGFTIGAADGIEINILSLVFGVDVLRPALKLPFIGRVGMKDAPFGGAD